MQIELHRANLDNGPRVLGQPRQEDKVFALMATFRSALDQSET